MTKNLLLKMAAAGALALLPGIARANCTYQPGTATVGVAHAGGYVTVPIYTQGGCAWSAAASHAWIAVTGGRGYGSGSITFYVAPNPGRTPRSATVGQTIYVPPQLGGRSGGSSGYYQRLFGIQVVQY